MKESLYVWAAIQNIIIGLSIAFIKRSPANVALGAFFILSGLYTGFQYFLRFQGYLAVIPETVFISDFIYLLLGPSMYLYFKLILKRSLKPADASHFLPAILFAIYYIVHQLIILHPFRLGNYFYQPIHLSVLLLISISVNTYLFFAFAEIKKHQEHNQIKEEVRKWLTLLLFILGLKCIDAIYLVVSKAFIGNSTKMGISIFEVLFISLETITLITAGIFNFKSSTSLTLSEMEIFQVQKKKRDYVSEKDIPGLISQLNDLMTKDKLFIQPDIDEKSVAKALNIPSYQLSYLINTHLGKSFNEFINENRINEAKKLLLNPEKAKHKMYSIALDCGYNSESVFYTNFKKYTGTTPNKFQKSMAATRGNESPNV